MGGSILLSVILYMEYHFYLDSYPLADQTRPDGVLLSLIG